MHPKILYEDTHLMVVDKPAGLLSQGEKTGDENLVDWAREYLRRNYVGLVHRLDRNTSGTMVIAKRSKSAKRLTESLQSGDLKRSYLAWILGSPKTAKFRWEHWLAKDEATNKVHVADQKPANGKLKYRQAILNGQTVRQGVWSGQPITLIEIRLETGRSHQIRAQAAHEGHPILGDRKYGKLTGQEFSRTALHSHKIEFPHPMSDEILKFEAPLPADLNI